MKRILSNWQKLPYLIPLLISLILIGCSKEEPIELATLQTTAATEISASSARSGGFISSDGGAQITSRGVVWGSTSGPRIEQHLGMTENGTGDGSFTSGIEGLASNSTYFVRAYAVNTAGTEYGNEVSFSTIDYAVVSTAPIKDIRSNSALGGGEIINDGGSPIIEKGVCWSTSENPTINDNSSSDGEGDETFTSAITNLTSGTVYYVRAYAENTGGVSYGDQVSFMALEIISDIEGNEYDIVQIGDQSWMAENLRTTKFSDGTSIPLESDGSSWANLTTPAYCWYENDEVTFGVKYGPLYNWHAVDTDKLCPSGWHVPSNTEWETLLSELGGALDALQKMKSTDGWLADGNNESGFRGLPGGTRVFDGAFIWESYDGTWWTSSPSFNNAHYYNIPTLSSAVRKITGDQTTGCSVRCVKD